jgi:hypothetical protein
MTTEATPGALGSNDQAGPMVAAREAFERWCADNGHGTLDDMMMPLDRALKNLLWTAWEAGYAAQRLPPKWRIVAGHPALWVNVRALRDALDHEDKRNVLPYAYGEKQATDDVCLLVRDGA